MKLFFKNLNHKNKSNIKQTLVFVDIRHLPWRFREDIFVILVNPNTISVISQSSSHHLLSCFYKLKPRKITPNAFSLTHTYSDTYPSMAASLTTLVVSLLFIFPVTKHTPFLCFLFIFSDPTTKNDFFADKCGLTINSTKCYVAGKISKLHSV